MCHGFDLSDGKSVRDGRQNKQVGPAIPLFGLVPCDLAYERYGRRGRGHCFCRDRDGPRHDKSNIFAFQRVSSFDQVLNSFPQIHRSEPEDGQRPTVEISWRKPCLHGFKSDWNDEEFFRRHTLRDQRSFRPFGIDEDKAGCLPFRGEAVKINVRNSARKFLPTGPFFCLTHHEIFLHAGWVNLVNDCRQATLSQQFESFQTAGIETEKGINLRSE